jgi:hypothetical protein
VAEERQIIIDVEIDSKDFDKEIGEINTQLKENQEQLKELNKDYKGNSEAIARLEAQNRKLSESKRDLIKQSNTESNSLNALRSRLADLTKERNNTDTSTEKGAARFRQLQKEILNTTTAIKGFEEESGDFRRNVGNYTNSIKEAIVGNTGFGKSIAGITNTLKVNPFVLLIGVLVPLIDKVKALTPLMDGLNAILTPISQVLERIVGIIQNGLLAAVEGFRSGGIIGAIKAFGNAFEDAGKQIGEAYEQGKRIAELGILIKEGEIGLIKTTAQLQKRIAELKFIGEDVTKSTKERIAALQEAFKLEQEIEEGRVRGIKLQLEEAQLRAAQNDTDRETRLAIAQLEAELLNAERERFEKTKDINNQLNGLRQAETAKRLADEKILLDAAKKSQDEFTKIYEEGVGQRVAIADQAMERMLQLNATELKVAIDTNNKRLSITEQRIKEEEAAEVALAQMKVQLANESLGNIQAIFGQQSAISKAAALTQIGIDTASAISSLVRNSEANPANAVTFGGAGILQFAAGITRIGANIANAKRLLEGGGNIGTGSNSQGGAPSNTRQPQTGNQLQGVNAGLLTQFGDGARNQAAQNDSISAAIGSQRLYVAVSDINKGQRAATVKVTESRLS